ncbi:FKBP-type peptidyl-prolyl cis-trans isomerase [Agromyces sp. ISL-38]|uniref:FKBP-type peptidyl-prolyl cis-trans isomerase n=1 Tax=Agromyces sp. ISL-38 TaxID=2819107 RepID=UPI001BEC9D40|nr:FKBP-type peptidyl-prolyl cis-trans isomerase [Agromyces sp. ISL-38]MBT2500020.1 FKBP-type peptidyl-prolyl cis-trans isomerase [Agromyces sp. ISL-38]
MRSSLALIATAGLVAVALSGCAAAPAPQASAGDSSDAVTVSGKFGEAPKVDFPTPLSPGETQCTEVIAGEGELLQEGQLVLLGASFFNGTTGEELRAIGYDDQPAPLALGGEKTAIAFTKGLSCAREGSRVVIVAPSEEIIPPGEDPESAKGGDSIVAVFDVQRAFPGHANGTPQLTRDGFPAVVLAPDGRPGITVPKGDPPTKKESEVEVLKRGAGGVVEDGDTVVAQYTGVTWADGKVFDSSWKSGTPVTFTVGTGEESQVVPGFAKAIIGQKVGSQVAVIVPPSEGYGDQASEKIPAGSTLFYVIDILGTY